jgi:hypothetical protein
MMQIFLPLNKNFYTHSEVTEKAVVVNAAAD